MSGTPLQEATIRTNQPARLSRQPFACRPLGVGHTLRNKYRASSGNDIPDWTPPTRPSFGFRLLRLRQSSQCQTGSGYDLPISGRNELITRRSLVRVLPPLSVPRDNPKHPLGLSHAPRAHNGQITGSLRRDRWFEEDPRYNDLEITSTQVGVISWDTAISSGSLRARKQRVHNGWLLSGGFTSRRSWAPRAPGSFLALPQFPSDSYRPGNHLLAGRGMRDADR